MKRPTFHAFVILGAVRTGSNSLERSLDQHPDIKAYGELFNPDFFGHRNTESQFGLSMAEREADPLSVLERMRQNGPELPGFRLFAQHDERVMDAVLHDPQTAKIVLHRNTLDSYISLMIARQTDQWVMGNVRTHKSAQITFDPADYERYQAEQNTFYSDIAVRLQEAGQAAFHISFDQLRSAATLNGALKFLGATGEINGPDTSLKPQNPGGSDQKVTNPDALVPYLGEFSEVRTPRPPQIKKFITSSAHKLLYAPIAGTEQSSVIDALGQIESRHTQKTLKNWLDAHPDFVSFSMVAHPLRRAFFAFETLVAMRDGDGFDKLRRRLVKFHDVVLPDTAQVEPWRRGFTAFLTFLERNLAGQTGIAVDDLWAPQFELIAAITAQQPISRIFREDEIAAALSANFRVSVKAAKTAETTAPALHQLYTDEIERLCRKCYRQDYRKFGFGVWSSGRH